MQTIDEALNKLNKSKFRSRFHLSYADRRYISEKGMDTIRKHAEDFVEAKLGPAYIVGDGKQTPMTGHPVFKAMHATGCCCRKCLAKWYKVPEGVALSETQKRKIVNFLMVWIEREIA